MDDHHGALQIVVFPWLAFGHMLPFLELSKSLAKRGHRISFISTPRNIERLPSIPSKIAPLIDFVPFPLPQVDNLPADAESTGDLLPDQVQFLKKAFDGLECLFSQFLQQEAWSRKKPDWIILDFAQYWALPIASNFDVPCAFFHLFPASALSFYEGYVTAEDGGLQTTPEELTKPPKWIPFPSNLAYRLHEAPSLIWFFRDNSSGIPDARRFGSVLKGCSLVAVRSCFELESIWLNLAGKLCNKPVIPVGLLPPDRREDQEEEEEEEEAEAVHASVDDDEAKILGWLSTQSPRSVVFVAFGSEATVSDEQQHDLALGLEMSKTPFLWSLRRPAKAVAELLPQAFEERTRGYGLVATCWVPQLKILSHASVGAFLTHCGWSSVIECLHFGHPLIMMPLIADQGLIARRLEEEKVGVEVPRDENDGSFTGEGVAKAIRMVMVEEEGKCFRSNAQKLQQVFSNNDLHESYIDGLIQQLRRHREIERDA